MTNVVSRSFVEARQLGKQVTTRDGMLTLLHDINFKIEAGLSLIHISEPTRPFTLSRMPSSA